MSSTDDLLPDPSPFDTSDSIAWFVTKPERGWPLLFGGVLLAVMLVFWFSDDRRGDLPLFYTGAAVTFILIVWGVWDLFWKPDIRDQALVRYAGSEYGHELLVRGDALEDRLCRHADAVNSYRRLRNYLGAESSAVAAACAELLGRKQALEAQAYQLEQAQLRLKAEMGYVAPETR